MLAVRDATAADRDVTIALWDAAGLLVNPLNDPVRDFDFALASDNATILLGEDDGALAAAAMVGHDGHRGWVYYVATDPGRRNDGLGRRIMHAAEHWVAERGVPKMQLMVRASNTRVIGFYQNIGYVVEPREVMSKRLDGRAVQMGGQSSTEPVTITYLEMTEPPKLPRIEPAGHHRLALLRAQPPTLSFYRYLYDAIGRDWHWTDRKLLGDAALLEIVRDENVEVYVLYADGSPAGAFELDRRASDVIDLAYFGIMPDFIGQRFGPYLLGEALETMWRYGPRRVTVNTCTLDHPKALGLYQRFGFEVVARQTVANPWQRGEAESDD
ncbi:MAG: GNAT family acetyltransferase [Alphaproteobacteria bacterium]